MDKQYILDEIKRTARANGGKPLGKPRFFRETGIKESDWEGRYWVRWNDAVREAGFEPNILQPAFEKTMLIEKFINLMRELGHFPVDAELQMKSRSDASFPSAKTYDSRLGTKKQRAAAIQEYCEGQTGYDDVMALCIPIVKSPVSFNNDVGREKNFGFVYLMKAGHYYKIGRTGHVGGRERDLGIQLPHKIITVHSIRTDDPIGIEAYWHKRFEEKRQNGEWFDLTRADVNAFKRRKFM